MASNIEIRADKNCQSIGIYTENRPLCKIFQDGLDNRISRFQTSAAATYNFLSETFKSLNKIWLLNHELLERCKGESKPGKADLCRAIQRITLIVKAQLTRYDGEYEELDDSLLLIVFREKVRLFDDFYQIETDKINYEIEQLGQINALFTAFNTEFKQIYQALLESSLSAKQLELIREIVPLLRMKIPDIIPEIFRRSQAKLQPQYDWLKSRLIASSPHSYLSS